MCPFCDSQNEDVIYKNKLFRVILANDDNYPGFLRLVLNKHVREMSDLEDRDANLVFTALRLIEKIVRQQFKPDKINLASLGNVTPHLHWHIIPRYTNDRHFPNPIWGAVTNPNYAPQENLICLQRELFVILHHPLNSIFHLSLGKGSF